MLRQSLHAQGTLKQEQIEVLEDGEGAKPSVNGSSAPRGQACQLGPGPGAADPSRLNTISTLKPPCSDVFTTLPLS